jgi:hypothetical protein
LGPGAGGTGTFYFNQNSCCDGGGGAGYGLPGLGSANAGGTTYGSNSLVPLIGGSGGGGGAGSLASNGFSGTGGGGGGGAILIAASGAVNLTGTILASGGNSGNFIGGAGAAGNGGGGSGGAIRVVASSITGAGSMNVNGGISGTNGFSVIYQGGNGGRGRVSTEIATTGTLVLTGLPSLTIASVGGVATPAAPTGNGDVALAANAPNPITVTFTTTGVPTGGTIKLTMTPARGAATTATSSLITGSLTAGTASATIDIPPGVSTLFASSSFTLTVAMGDSLSKFAMGERVEKILLTAAVGEPGKAMLVTVSGKQYPASDEALRLAAKVG